MSNSPIGPITSRHWSAPPAPSASANMSVRLTQPRPMTLGRVQRSGTVRCCHHAISTVLAGCSRKPGLTYRVRFSASWGGLAPRKSDLGLASKHWRWRKRSGAGWDAFISRDVSKSWCTWICQDFHEDDETHTPVDCRDVHEDALKLRISSVHFLVSDRRRETM
jgi:hypothetical protein